VILVGEIRDKDTAITAIQAAMTGHQVYSSLHTNDALSAIPRLMNIGVPNYLMSGSLICVVAQRLARRLCSYCKKEMPLDPFEKRLLGPKYSNVDKIFKAQGCERCTGGYKGRIMICEVLPFDRDLDEMIVAEASRKEMFEYALKHGFVPIVEDGLQKVIAGVTDLKELVRVVDMTDRMN
jgi:type II secretory ATPase GspE/PulE/Tfp pilus assembly ATPase PilB-like protein